MLDVLQRLTKLTRQSIIKADTKQLLNNLFLLAHQLNLTSGLRVIDNGLGLPLYGVEERVVDYAALAVDQNATLPGDVLQQYFDTMITLSNSLHRQIVCYFRSFANWPPLLLTSSSVLGSHVR